MIERWERTPGEEAHIDKDNERMVKIFVALEAA